MTNDSPVLLTLNWVFAVMSTTAYAGIMVVWPLATTHVSAGEALNRLVDLGVTLFLLGLGWLVRQGIKQAKIVLERINHIDECMDGVKRASEADRDMLTRYNGEVAAARLELAAVTGYLKGMAGVPLDSELNEIPPLVRRGVDGR